MMEPLDHFQAAGTAPSHHPTEDLLLAYAAGGLDEAMSLVVATHLALCPRCRAEVTRLEAVGGALIDDLAPAALGVGVLDTVLARLDEPNHDPIPLPVIRRRPVGPAPVLPEPLRSYIGCDIGRIGWSRTIPGLEEADIACGDRRRTRVRMMRIRGGMGMPRHTHHGNELTLVLAGGFADETGHFLRGDLAVTDPSIDHRPIADDDGDCICLAVTDAPLRLTGRFLRLLNPFLRL